MLQKVQQGRLTRRTLLRGLSLGAGILALGGLSGCTQFLKRSESSVPLAPAGASNARQRLAQAAHEAKEAWKSVLRAQNKIERVDAAELERRLVSAKHKMLQLLDQLDAEGITAQIDQQLRALPERFEYSLEVKEYYRREFQNVLTEEQGKRLEEALSKPATNDAIHKVLNKGGVSPYLREKLAEVRLQPSLTPLTAAAWPDWGCTAAACLTAAAVAAWTCQIFGWASDACTHAWAVAAGFCLAAFIFCP